MAGSGDNIDVSNNEAEHRFEAKVDGGTAFARYELRGRDAVFTHTEVPEQARGEGVGDALARAGVDWARGKGLNIVPECPFIAAYMRRHNIA